MNRMDLEDSVEHKMLLLMHNHNHTIKATDLVDRINNLVTLVHHNNTVDHNNLVHSNLVVHSSSVYHIPAVVHHRLMRNLKHRIVVLVDLEEVQLQHQQIQIHLRLIKTIQ